MSRYDDEFDGPDGSEDTDPIIRDLRAQIVRLEAQLDQLTASVRERAEEAAVIQAQLTELEQRVARLEARRRRDEWLIVFAWLVVGASLALWLIRI
jgi:septal ring factor EnvC (AmiA/AmiB activator)